MPWSLPVSRTLWLSALLSCAAAGCTPTYYQPSPYYSPTPTTPSYPAAPGYPVTLNPSDPTTGPVASNPGYPSIPADPVPPNNPTPPNTVPVSTPTNNPVPIPPTSNPTTPSTPPDITVQWAPWPLPPKSGVAVAATQRSSNAVVHAARKQSRGHHRHLSVATRPGSHAERISRDEAALTTASASAAAEAGSGVVPADAVTGSDDHQIVDGANPTPMEDLHYRGGKMLQDMGYVNLYISGEQAWNMSDVNNIDRAIAAAMKDEYLNNVIRQYFNNQPIGTTVYPSHPLIGYIPKNISRGDIQYFVQYLYGQGYLTQYDLETTIFNFLCPPGTILSDDDARSGSATSETPQSLAAADEKEEEDDRPDIIGFPENEAEVDSINGLGGYHGSIHLGNKTVYYSAIVYSESRADGFKNGIPAFPEGWKNTVATMYHELQEARTDPDVEDVIRNPYQPNIISKLGWTSDAGEEIGDFPLHDNVSIRKIIQEVPLADGSGTVPIQLQYSNAVHGPEGPIPQLHPAAPR